MAAPQPTSRQPASVPPGQWYFIQSIAASQSLLTSLKVLINVIFASRYRAKEDADSDLEWYLDLGH